MKREHSGLSSPSLQTTLSSPQRSRSRQKSTILTSMKKARCVCQSLVLKTGSQPQKLTKVRDGNVSLMWFMSFSWQESSSTTCQRQHSSIFFLGMSDCKMEYIFFFFRFTINGALIMNILVLFQSFRVSLIWWALLSRNIHWGPISQRNTAEIVQNSWRTQRSSHGNTAKSDLLTDDPKMLPTAVGLLSVSCFKRPVPSPPNSAEVFHVPFVQHSTATSKYWLFYLPKKAGLLGVHTDSGL